MRKLTGGLSSLAIGLAFVFPGSSGMSAVTSTISGTVTTVYENRPVENARITAKDPQGNILAIADSDQAGNFSIVLAVGIAYELELDPPGIYTQKSPTETPKGVMTVKGETVDWKVSFEGGPWIFGAGVITAIGVPLGVSLTEDGGVRTGSQ